MTHKLSNKQTNLPVLPSKSSDQTLIIKSFNQTNKSVVQLTVKCFDIRTNFLSFKKHSNWKWACLSRCSLRWHWICQWFVFSLLKFWLGSADHCVWPKSVRGQSSNGSRSWSCSAPRVCMCVHQQLISDLSFVSNRGSNIHCLITGQEGSAG